MPSTSGTAIVTIVRLKGIAICTIAAGPLGLLVVLVGLTTEGNSLAVAVADMQEAPLLLIGSTLSLAMLPSIVAVALISHVLGRLDKDVFVVTTMSGAVVGYAVVTLLGVMVMGEAPGWNPETGFDLSDATLIASANALLSALYWVNTVRVERNRRKLAEQHELALRVME